MSKAYPAIQALLDQAIDEHGPLRVERMLRSLIVDSRMNVLTIVANKGRHKIPEKYLRGEIFVASTGDIDFSSRTKAQRTFVQILRKLNSKLLEKSWASIYLVPTGHPTLSLQLKAAVYRVTRLNTIDLFYLDGTYFDVDVDLRKLSSKY